MQHGHPTRGFGTRTGESRDQRAAGRVATICALLVAAAVTLALGGCGGNSAVNPLLDPPTLPTTPAAATSNTYVGTQSPGIWSLTLDDTNKVFSYDPVTVPAPATQGAFAVQDGIVNMGSGAAGVSAGMAVERATRAAMLRPGDNTTAPVAMVNPSGCFAVGGRVRFTFAGLQSPQANGNLNGYGAAYGTLVVSTSTDGKTYQIGDQRQYLLPTFGSSSSPGTAAGTLAVTGAPLEYSATCTQTNGIATVKANANPVFESLPAFTFNSAGYFIQDRPLNADSAPDSNAYVGIVMPSSPLAASTISSGSYRGFVFEPGAPGIPATQPMRLDPLNAKLNGGVYANDDPTGTSGTELTISLGTEDSALFGVYPQATLTKKDPAGNCAVVNHNQGNSSFKSGFGPNGVPTCTSQGVAVVGKPDGKFMIYFTALDGTSSDPDNAYVLQMYLYQQ